MSSYAYNAQVFPVQWAAQSKYPTSLTDGTSQTILFTEQRADFTDFWPDWGASIGDNNGPQPTGPAAMFRVQANTDLYENINQKVAHSPHIGGIMCGLGDGSVRLVNTGVSLQTWSYALFPNDGMPLGSDW